MSLNSLDISLFSDQHQQDAKIIDFPEDFDFTQALMDDPFEINEIPFNPNIFDEDTPMVQENDLVRTPKRVNHLFDEADWDFVIPFDYQPMEQEAHNVQ